MLERKKEKNYHNYPDKSVVKTELLSYFPMSTATLSRRLRVMRTYKQFRDVEIRSGGKLLINVRGFFEFLLFWIKKGMWYNRVLVFTRKSIQRRSGCSIKSCLVEKLGITKNSIMKRRRSGNKYHVHLQVKVEQCRLKQERYLKKKLKYVCKRVTKGYLVKQLRKPYMSSFLSEKLS